MDLETVWLLYTIVEHVCICELYNKIKHIYFIFSYFLHKIVYFLAIPEEQNLRYCVYKIDSKEVEAVCSNYVPLTPKSTLRWIGFSDYGSLCILDSIGILQMLFKSYWTPLCCVDDVVIYKLDNLIV